MAGDRIEELYAFVIMDDGDGNEGVPAITLTPDMMVPMMGADLDRIESLRPIAQQMARMRGAPVELRVWHGPYDLVEVIVP